MKNAMTAGVCVDDLSKPSSPAVQAAEKEEAVALCLAEGLTCTAVAQHLGIPVSSLAKWVWRDPLHWSKRNESG